MCKTIFSPKLWVMREILSSEYQLCLRQNFSHALILSNNLGFAKGSVKNGFAEGTHLLCYGRGSSPLVFRRQRRLSLYRSPHLFWAAARCLLFFTDILSESSSRRQDRWRLGSASRGITFPSCGHSLTCWRPRPGVFRWPGLYQ
jgi:hypothetical protein